MSSLRHRPDEAVQRQPRSIIARADGFAHPLLPPEPERELGLRWPRSGGRRSAGGERRPPLLGDAATAMTAAQGDLPHDAPDQTRKRH
jgi:hypothetical protein